MTMPSATIKGYLTAYHSPNDASPFTINMSAGTTGTNPVAGDFIFMYVVASASTANAVLPIKPTGFTELVAWQNMGTSVSTAWALWVKRREVGETNYEITQTNTASVNKATITTFWIDGADAKDVGDWVIGTQGTRAASGGTFNTNAPEITTTLVDTMVFAFGVERTSAAETAADLTVSGTGWTKRDAYITGSGGGTIAIASKPIATAGASGVVTFTNINTQATNGAALQIGIPASGVIPSGYPGKLWDGAAVLDGEWYVRSGSSTNLPVTWAGMVHDGYDSVTEMLAQDFFYCSHRGGSRNWPEQSLQGYTQSAIRGYGALECSLARSSDGVWFGLHDASLDRTSLGTGGGSGTTHVASAMTWAAIQAYDMLPATGAPVNSLHQPYTTLEDILDAYLSTHVIFIDPKSALAHRAELVSILKNRPEWQDKIVAKSVPGNSNNSWLTLARAEGFATNAMFYESDTFASFHAQGDILGMEYGAASGTWTTIKSYGKPVMAHILPSQASLTTALSLNADGAMVSGVVQIPLVTM